jgi:hypothetical protein
MKAAERKANPEFGDQYTAYFHLGKRDSVKLGSARPLNLKGELYAETVAA